MRLFIGVAAIFLVVGVLSACHSAPTATSTSPSPMLSRVMISGASTIASGSTAQLSAAATYTDGSKKDVTATATWHSSDTSILALSATGLATGLLFGDVTVTATLNGLQASQSIQVVSAGTARRGVFRLIGIVTDDEGHRVPNAKITVESCSDIPGGCAFMYVSGTSDAAGVFSVDFNGDPNLLFGCAAFAWAYKEGYDVYARYLCSKTPDFSQSLLLHRPKQIVAGESAAVTVAPDDSVCYSNDFDEPGTFLTPWLCRAVHITVPFDGTLTVEALPNSPVVAAPTGLDVEYGSGLCCGKRVSIPVTAGTDVPASILMDSRSTASQSFTLNTSLARQ